MYFFFSPAIFYFRKKIYAQSLLVTAKATTLQIKMFEKHCKIK